MARRHPFPLTSEFNRQAIVAFCSLYGACASTHTLNTQRCLEYVLEQEAAKHTGAISRVYSILARLFSEDYAEPLIGPVERRILCRLLGDLARRLEGIQLDRAVEILDKKLSIAASKGVAEVQHKKNPLGLKPEVLDALGPQSAFGK